MPERSSEFWNLPRSDNLSSTYLNKMDLAKISLVTGRAVPVSGDDIDTDRIIPARFMKCVTFDGLGDFLFYDVKHKEDGSLREHPLNAPEYREATIMVSGDNFGCGSSREHAPQALFRAGFRAILAESFAEIFFGNATNLGIPCLSLSREGRLALSAALEEDPTLQVEVNLENLSVSAGDSTWPASIRPGARQALMEGRWDPLGELVEGGPEVDRTAATLAYLNS